MTCPDCHHLMDEHLAEDVANNLPCRAICAACQDAEEGGEA